MPYVALALPARTHRLFPVTLAVAASLLLGACASGGTSPLLSDASTSSPSLAKADAPKSELQKATDYWGKKSADDPTDARAAVNYAKNLKAMGSKREALTVLQSAYNRNPTDRELNSEFGRLALEHDQVSLAQKLLEAADDQTNPDWRVVSARGTALAKQGKHTEAIGLFERARLIAPEQPSIMNNLAMAYAMNGQATKAEGLLRQAAARSDADQRVHQNLALVLGLNGKHDEAKVMGADQTSPEASTHNAEMVRQLVQANEPPDADVPVAPSMKAATAQRGNKAKLSTASVSTASVATGPAAKTAKGKSAAATDIDASELVRRLADGDGAAVKK